MSASVDVDIGGTFTDCFVRYQDQVAWCKTRTTTYDLSESMLQAIDEASRRLGTSRSTLLGDTEIIRYSTTLALNTLVQRQGPRLAYIVTEGFEDTLLIGRASQWSDGLSIKEQRDIARVTKPEPLIPRELVVGVKERLDYEGNVVRPFDENDFLQKLDYLVDQGVRGFVVCLLWSHNNPVHEWRIRDLIEREYNETYLGSMPVFLSSENSPKRFEYTRSTMTLLNAYLHKSMHEELSGIGQQLRSEGYQQPLMMVHNTGGMASVFRTSALETFSGGPVAGLVGGLHLGGLYGFGNVVVTDMGGTSFDVGKIVQGSTRFYQSAPTIDRWLIDATVLDTHSIGAGGGSIARLNADLGGRLEVGPDSAGSMPGPACYDQGGREPTVTDADLVLGYLNEDNFNGGRIQLSRRRATRAIKDRIGDPLGIAVQQAAFLIKRVIDAQMGSTIHKETVLKGYDPRDFVIFAVGGAGPLHACGYAEAAGMSTVVVFPFSSTFCAFGSSAMDVMHVYERSRHFELFNGSNRSWLSDYEDFNATVRELKGEAQRDLRGEGFDTGRVQYELELDMKFGGQLNVKRVASPLLELETEDNAINLYKAFEKEYSSAYSKIGLNPDAGVEIDALVLKARIPQGTSPPPRLGESVHGTQGTRGAIWHLDADPVDTPVYGFEAMTPGKRLSGPALVEAETTTVGLPPGWWLRVDDHSALIMTDEKESDR